MTFNEKHELNDKISSIKMRRHEIFKNIKKLYESLEKKSVVSTSANQNNNNNNNNIATDNNSTSGEVLNIEIRPEKLMESFT
jgi:predicted HNH restriction endonuclease